MFTFKYVVIPLSLWAATATRIEGGTKSLSGNLQGRGNGHGHGQGSGFRFGGGGCGNRGFGNGFGPWNGSSCPQAGPYSPDPWLTPPYAFPEPQPTFPPPQPIFPPTTFPPPLPPAEIKTDPFVTPSASVPHVLEVYSPVNRRFETAKTFATKAEAERAAQSLENQFWLIDDTALEPVVTYGDRTAALQSLRQGRRVERVITQVVAQGHESQRVDDLLGRLVPTLNRSNSEPLIPPAPTSPARPADKAYEPTGYEDLAGSYEGVGKDNDGKPCQIELLLDTGGKFELNCSGKNLRGRIDKGILTQDDGTRLGSVERNNGLLKLKTANGPVTFFQK